MNRAECQLHLWQDGIEVTFLELPAGRVIPNVLRGKPLILDLSGRSLQTGRGCDKVGSHRILSQLRFGTLFT